MGLLRLSDDGKARGKSRGHIDGGDETKVDGGQGGGGLLVHHITIKVRRTTGFALDFLFSFPFSFPVQTSKAASGWAAASNSTATTIDRTAQQPKAALQIPTVLQPKAHLEP